MATVHLHRDDVPDTLALLNALLADGYLSTSEKAVVHIAHGCAILERHGGGLPVELRWQVRAAVESITE